MPETNTLETTFRTPSGTMVLRDGMALAAEEDGGATLAPDHELLRELAGLDGEVEVEILYEPRPDYARASPKLEDRGAFGLWCPMKRGVLVLCSEPPLAVAGDGRGAQGRIRIRAGERRYCSLTYSEGMPAIVPALGREARDRLRRATDWWRRWAARCTYGGPYREMVVRSALALKLLSYVPSGAIVAAPTTSLPETLHGADNWDYRYCWLRDGSFTYRSLWSLGHEQEAMAFLDWMLYVTRLTQPELKVVYDVFGRAPAGRGAVPSLGL